MRPERHHDCDVLIIGSGAGGATTAATLAEAGHDVLIVEEGSWVPQGSVTPFSLEQMNQQYRSGGVTVALGLPSIAYTEGRCAGGGTEVNSGLYRRPPGYTLDRWRADYGIVDFATDDLEAICDEVEDVTERPDRSRRTDPGQRHPESGRRGPRLAARRDPPLDDLPRERTRRRRPAPEHDRDLPASGPRRRRPAADRASSRPPRDARRHGAAGGAHVDDRR